MKKRILFSFIVTMLMCSFSGCHFKDYVSGAMSEISQDDEVIGRINQLGDWGYEWFVNHYLK